MTPLTRTREAIRASRRKVWEGLRNWFFTGIVVGAPIGITIWLVWAFVSFVDKRIKPLIPPEWNPETYLKFALPGMGIVIAVLGLTIIGALTASFLGKSLLAFSERVVARLPVVGKIYGWVKQVFETFASHEASSFKEAVLVEYPGPGLWAIGFITSRTPGPEISAHLGETIAVMVPTSPNPAMGHLVYVAPEKLKKLDMSMEQAAKLVISFGILNADQFAVEGAPKVLEGPPRPGM